MSWLWRAFSRNIAEIRSDPALRLYGALLAFLHVLSFFFWRLGWRLENYITVDAPALCWPFFENCHAYRFLDETGVLVLLGFYLALAVVSMLLFLPKRLCTFAYFVLLALNVLKTLILIQDYGLHLNQHYMAGAITLAYLFIPRKRSVVPCLIVALYFWSGTLKLNAEWLSGAALYEKEKFWIKGALIPWACAYAVMLELVIVFGLLARRGWIFWGTLAQLGLFHFLSWPIVGFFYPNLMYTILALFPLCRWIGPTGANPSVGSLFRGREPVVTYAALAVFALLQLVPRAMPGDTAINGEGRLFALHMFDASVVCDAFFVLHDREGTRREEIPNSHWSTRIRCDPLVYFNVAHTECRERSEDPGFLDLDLHLWSRRSTEPTLRSVIALTDFCRKKPTYDMWRPNDWILKNGPPGESAQPESGPEHNR